MFQLEMRKGTWSAVFILMTVPAGVITKKIIKRIKAPFEPATCSNAHYVQMVKWDNDTFGSLQNKKKLKSENISRL